MPRKIRAKKKAESLPNRGRMYIDRYELFSKETRTGNAERGYESVEFGEIIDELKQGLGDFIKISDKRIFVPLSIRPIIGVKNIIDHYAVECGISIIGKNPPFIKKGNPAVQYKKPDGEEIWIVPCKFSLSDSGNRVAIQYSKEGPKIVDVCDWIRQVLDIYEVASRYVPHRDFEQLFNGKMKVKSALFRFKRKGSLESLPPTDQMEAEAQLATELNVGILQLYVKAPPKRAIKQLWHYWTFWQDDQNRFGEREEIENIEQNNC